MTDRDDMQQEEKARRTTAAGDLWPHLKMILDALRASRQRFALYWLGGAIIVIVSATAYGQIRLNAWNKPFYDALSRKELSAVTEQLLVFAYIAGALLVLNVAQTWLAQMAKLKLREGLTRDLFFQWLKSHRCFRIASLGEIGVNPDQRIHADAQRLAEVSTDLGIGLLQATLLLISFVGVLWELSEGVTFEALDRKIVIPGYMVWCALLYASVASFASWRVGRPLVELGAQRYARESEMRFALMHVNEYGEAIAVSRGQKLEEDRLHQEFDRLLDVLRRIVTATTNLTWVTAGYGWFTIVAPIIVAAPAYFAGNLTFGGLLMAVGAFTQVQQSLRWFVDNAGTIADWRATLHRVGGFRQALLDIDKDGLDARRISFEETFDDRLVLDELCILSPAGLTSLSEGHVEIAPDQHVLIVGEPRSGKTRLFQAMAGLWTSGSGRIRLPSAEHVLFVPKRAYIPDLSLRAILSYPSPSNGYPEEAYVAALMRFDLQHLAPWLDRVARWEKELTDTEQQQLAFARVLLHKPRFVIVDEAIESLSPHARQTLFDVFGQELTGTALIYVSGPRSQDKFFGRVIYLTLDTRNRLPEITAASGAP
ncbi:ABC transporter ATP-binding protein/permease [Methylocystis sp.]|uniref:ABC transporter ATP-binding protein/permease n=1 Tax=Methylocystis sp. TaxID=1911079 RepID=UPI0025F3255F|nr:ABC transporter ATP-binding protein/permease [Methylocystis sp.]